MFTLLQLRNIPWRQLLRSPAVWAVCLASLGRNLIFSAMVVEQSQYFLDSFEMNVADVSNILVYDTLKSMTSVSRPDEFVAVTVRLLA